MEGFFFQEKVLEQLIPTYEKKELSVPHTHTKMNTKWIIDFSVKPKAVTLLAQNLCDQNLHFTKLPGYLYAH